MSVRDSAFKNFPNKESGRMSIVLGDRLDELGREVESVLDESQSGFGVVSLIAEEVRKYDQELERSPTDDEPAHGDVVGQKATARRKQLASIAKWVIPPSEK